jgi:hypothetical protein
MRDYLQGLINSEQSILSTIATNAINAGATQEQLNQINQEAQAAAAGNPIVSGRLKPASRRRFKTSHFES